MFTILNKELDAAKLLLDIGALSINSVSPFKYADGTLNPIFTDCRLLASYPEARKEIIDMFYEYINNYISDNADIIVGTGNSGISLSTYLAKKLSKPAAYIRAAAKEHGKGKQVEGVIKENSNIVLITDIFSTEQHVPIAVNVLKELNCNILVVLSIFTNKLGITESFLGSNNIPYFSITNLDSLLTVAQMQKIISAYELPVINSWRKDRLNWENNRKEELKKTLQESKEIVAKTLLKINAVSLNPKQPFRFTSGMLSPIYTDNRLLMSYPREWSAIMNNMKNVIISFIGLQNVDCIAGTATAGIPHASFISAELNLPMITVKSDPDQYGKLSQIEGTFKPGSKVLIIEDLISTGKSSIATARAIKAGGGLVEYCMGIFTYGMEVAKQTYSEENIRLITLTDFQTLVEVAARDGYIKEQEMEIVLDWAKDNKNWGKKMGFE